uniref:Uncharacterized protein n=1 Tax=Rhizophora mucronata TaxID=61149 RepID=A0A2P2PM85_RHIMU
MRVCFSYFLLYFIQFISSKGTEIREKFLKLNETPESFLILLSNSTTFCWRTLFLQVTSL